MVKEIIDDAREEMRQWKTVPHDIIMRGEIYFEGIKEELDGSFGVELGS